MSFLKTISYMISSELDKTLITLLDDDQDTYLNETKYYKFLEMMLGKNLKYSRNTTLEAFSRAVQKQTNWQGCLRHLMIFHKLTHDLGEQCYDWISSEKLKPLYTYKKQGLNLKMFVHKAMVAYYQNYLKRLSHDYDDLSICFHFDEQHQSKLAQDNISPLHSVSKLQHVLRYLIHIFSLFEVSLIDFKPCLLVKQVTYFCFTDCYHYYTYINNIIKTLLIDIFNLSPEDAVQLYEIYCQHILITRKLTAFFTLGNQLKEFSIKTPDFFVLIPQQNTKIELYIASLKSQNSKLSKTRVQQITNTEMSFSRDNRDDSGFTTKDLSKIISEIASGNKDNPTYKTNLFEPPMNIQKGKASPPKIRTLKTNVVVPWFDTSAINNLKVDESIDDQKTRPSVSSNVRVEVSAQFASNGLANTILQNSIDQQQSVFPLTQNESFLKDDISGSISQRGRIQETC